MPDEYDSDDDVRQSFEDVYAAIRARVANGGPSWPRSEDAGGSDDTAGYVGGVHHNGDLSPGNTGVGDHARGGGC